MKSPAGKRTGSSRKKSGSTKSPPATQATETTETTRTTKATYDEPLPFMPYRPVPVSSAPRRPSAAEAYSPAKASLDEALELANRAAAALRELAGPDRNTDVAIRARLDSLANHLQEVARYITRVYR